MDIEIEAKYMARCISLARNGSGNVSPNPMVGAVVVHNKRIIGEGFHQKYGEAHAEVNAIHSVVDQSLLRNSTLYVNLEPCSHHGKTPPCTELILKKEIPRVVVGCFDPYPEVSGRGVQLLRDAGVEVVTGVLADEAYRLNIHFMVSHSLRRPFISLKWAQTKDGFIDAIRTDASTPPLSISSPNMFQRTHKKRTEFDAIMVGTRTALLDNPSLTIRHWIGHSPVRVVIDKGLIIPSDFHLMDQSVQTIVYTYKKKKDGYNIRYVTLDCRGDMLTQLLTDLQTRHINSLLVEGGTALIESFLNQELWDEIQVEVSQTNGVEGVKAPVVNTIDEEVYGNKVARNVPNLCPNSKGGHAVIVYSRKINSKKGVLFLK